MQTQPKRVVIEYLFTGYTPPDDLEAFGVPASIVHADERITSATDLADIRADLDDHDYTLHGSHQTGRYQKHGRYRPTWREVWTAQAGEPRPTYVIMTRR